MSAANLPRGLRLSGTDWVISDGADLEVPHYEATTISADDAARALGLRLLARRDTGHGIVAVIRSGDAKFRAVHDSKGLTK